MDNFNSKYKKTNGVLTNKKLIQSLTEYLELLEVIRQNWKIRTCWYRGVSNYKYDLTPTTYRKDIWDFTIAKEKALISQFKRKSIPYLSNNHYENWELYQLMQHYGIPTRFLDWTESSLIALFFALLDIKKCEKASVWVIDPYRLNEIVTDREVVFFSMNTGDNIDYEVTNKYLNFDLSELPDFPIAVFPTHIDKRIISQKSCFTINGKLGNGFEKLMNNNDFRLIKLVFDNDFLEHIKYELITTGVTYSTIYPDIEGLSKDLKYEKSIN